MKNLFLQYLLVPILALGTGSQLFCFEPWLPKIDETQKERASTKLAEWKEANTQQLANPDPAFQGWWQLITRSDDTGFGFGALTNDIDTYIFIDLSQFDPIRNPVVQISTLCGTPLYPRECTSLDVGSGIVFSIYYVPSSNQLVSVFDVNGPLFDPTLGQSFWSLQLQPGKSTLCASNGSQPSWVGFNPPFGNLFQKVTSPQQPVRPFNDTDSAFPDVTNPVEIATYMYNSLLLNNNQPHNRHFHDKDYRSFREAGGIFEKMLGEGITYETKIRKVRVSTKGAHYRQDLSFQDLSLEEPFISYDRLTDIFTEAFSFATTGSTVEIKGFEGKWAALNGTYVNGVAISEMDGIPNPSPKHIDTSSSHKPHHGTFRNVYNHFLLDFDSSNKKKFPRDSEGWAVGIEGDPVVRVTHRFTPNMEYPAFYAAVRAMFFALYRVSQHNGYVAYFKPHSMFLIDTWDELRKVVKKDGYWGSENFPGNQALATRTSQAVPSGFYNNAALAERGVTTYNDPFGVNQLSSSRYDYNIVLANYIVHPVNLYWAIAGTPTGPTQFDPTRVGYKPVIPGPGPAQFVGRLGPLRVMHGRPYPENPDPEHYTIYGKSEGSTPLRDSNSYYMGLINPKLTHGKRVGYLRWLDEQGADPRLYMPTATFPPHVPVTIKYGREALSQVYSHITRYFQTEHTCDAVILDIRSNNGGFVFPTFTLAELFGDDRQAFTALWSKKDNGNSQLINLADATAFSFYNNNEALISESFARFFVGQNETNYGPGVVFRGTPKRPKKVIVLTDNAAASSGDVFPHLFLGEKLDGDLGSYTTCKILGDIDGRLKGGATQYMAVPVSASSNFLTTAEGDPVSPILFRVDSAHGGDLINGVTNIFYNQQSDLVAPHFAPTLRGTAGGAPLPNDWHNTVWPDLGLISPPKGHFSHRIPLKKPKFSHRSTWRDSWLEQAILAAID